MKLFSHTKEDDVIFLHADNQAMVRHKCTPEQLRDGLLLHVLYCGRVLIPIDFLLSNQAFGDLYLYEGKPSEKSDMYKLLKSGDILPIVYSPKYKSIKEYAHHSIQRGIVLSCTPNEWLQRAELLDEFKLLSPSNDEILDAYQGTLLQLVANNNLCREYFGKRATSFANELIGKIKSIELPYRSDIYRLAEQARLPKLKTALLEIADAAYYVLLADVFNVNPAVADATAPAIIAYYHGGGPNVPFIYAPGRERVIGTTLPDISTLSLSSVIEDLREESKRSDWLKIRREKLHRGYLDIADEEVWSTLSQWTELLMGYLSASGPYQRKRIIQAERKFKLKTDIVKVGSKILLIAGIVSSITELAQSGFPFVGVTFLTTSITTELVIDKLEKAFEKTKPVYGSVIPVSQTFTVKGERYG